MDYSARTSLTLNPPPNVVRVLDEAGVDKLVEFLERTPEFGFDLETNCTDDYFWRRMRTMQFGTNQEQYVIDLLAFCDGSSELLYNCQGDYGKNLHLAPRIMALIERLRPFLSTRKFIKVGVNLSFEYTCMYWLMGERITGLYDCLMAEKCIYAGLGWHASLKNYAFYSMDEMMGRYFGVSIDKTLQTSFNLEDSISDAQYEYAALDTRTPLAIKAMQQIVANGETVASLLAKNKLALANRLKRLNSILLGDNLNAIIQIENDAIGAFADMQVHGERLVTDKWLARTAKKKLELAEVIVELDTYFLPIVGSKLEYSTDEEIAQL